MAKKKRATKKPRGKARPRRKSAQAARAKRAKAASPKRAKAASAKRAKAARPKRAKASSAKRAKAPKPRAQAPRPRPARSHGGAPHGIGILSQHLDYTSHDVHAVRGFYADLLGLTVHSDPEIPYLRITTSDTSSLGFMPPMPGPPEQWRPPREPALYFMVDDVDRVHRTLLDQGVSFDQPPTDMPWGHRIARLRDPEGRLVVIAHSLRSEV